jgi:hypothetical protein
MPYQVGPQVQYEGEDGTVSWRWPVIDESLSATPEDHFGIITSFDTPEEARQRAKELNEAEDPEGEGMDLHLPL